MIRPTLAEAQALASDYSVVPIALEIFADQKTPLQILQKLRQRSPHWFILESVNGSDSWGRYTFLGYQPSQTIFGQDHRVYRVDGGPEAADSRLLQPEGDDALTVIRRLLSGYQAPHLDYLPPFTGGLVGYFAYEFLSNFMPAVALASPNTLGFRDFQLMLIDKLIAFDHFQQKIYLIVNLRSSELPTAYGAAEQELQSMQELILACDDQSLNEPAHCGEFTSSSDAAGFADQVRQLQRYIVEGDIFQAVLSTRFSAPFTGNLLNAYRALRTLNPSPYMVYMHLDDLEIACSSPETLIALRNGEISSFPLAGSCPRGQTAAADQALIAELLSDPKELAEHDMLVDLARNDVGRVSQFGSVQVREYRQVKQYSHISHLSSHVTGQLQPGADALAVLAATFPAGTLSGAPKQRACQIIDSLEHQTRGVYGGAIGYIDFTGNMDMCIGIRLAVLKAGQVHVQAGAGIVADSQPEREYDEALNKAAVIMEALQNSGEVLR
ncbi:MAG: anthranilate synthase component I family protein [Actinomycetia bacterium]|nr:anthranilate synthase component I family protein [Actinomycetes bacterium]